MTLDSFADDHHEDVRRIYETSFPESVRAHWDEISHPRDDEELLVLVDDGPVGFALLRHLGDTAYTFVRYFAVDDLQRGQGHGSRLLTDVRRHLEARGCTALLLDVEDPRTDPSHADDDRRRIAFYERHGLSLLPVPDYAPPDHGSTGDQVPLLLMGMPLREGTPLEGERLADCVRAVYRYRYGVDGPVTR